MWIGYSLSISDDTDDLNNGFKRSIILWRQFDSCWVMNYNVN